MIITVKLFASFRPGRFVVEERPYPEGTTIAHVVAGLGLPERELGILLVDGRLAELDTPLAEGVVLSLFPLLGGG